MLLGCQRTFKVFKHKDFSFVGLTRAVFFTTTFPGEKEAFFHDFGVNLACGLELLRAVVLEFSEITR